MESPIMYDSDRGDETKLDWWKFAMIILLLLNLVITSGIGWAVWEARTPRSALPSLDRPNQGRRPGGDAGDPGNPIGPDRIDPDREPMKDDRGGKKR